MKCIVCHSDEITESIVQEQVREGADIFMLQMKIPVCKNCGERYYDRRTVQLLEEAKNMLKKEKNNFKQIGIVYDFPMSKIKTGKNA